MSLSVLSVDQDPTEKQLAARKKEMQKVDPSKYVNDTGVEELWAEKAFRHAQVYYKLICSINCTKLKLSKCDDELYQNFMVTFPRVNIEVIDEDKMKSVAGKRRWRNFCNMFEYHVEDFNFGTLLRLDCKDGYSESNTTLVPRVQFLAIEVARNRHGLNMCHLGKNPNPESGEGEEKKGSNDSETTENESKPTENGTKADVKEKEPLSA
ncbi:hypothetical protein ACHWQZ_G002587 [Mnemiopsis leidyi]